MYDVLTCIDSSVIIVCTKLCVTNHIITKHKNETSYFHDVNHICNDHIVSNTTHYYNHK